MYKKNISNKLKVLRYLTVRCGIQINFEKNRFKVTSHLLIVIMTTYKDYDTKGNY